MRGIFSTLVLGALLAGPVSARGSIILFSTFDPPGGSGYDLNVYFVDNAIGFFSVIGAAFTPGAGGVVTSYDVAFRQFFGAPGDVVDFRLVADDGSNYPDFGAVLDTFTLTMPALNVAQIVNRPTTLSPTLSAGTQYWLVASARSGLFDWFEATSESGTVYRDNLNDGIDNGLLLPGFRLPAFRVNGVSGSSGSGVPEPGSWVLAGVVLAGAGWMSARRRRRRGGGGTRIGDGEVAGRRGRGG